MKAYSILGILAGILSHLMCVHVTCSYCYLRWGAPAYNSASADAAFLYIIPYAIGILFCIVLCLVLRRRAKAKTE